MASWSEPDEDDDDRCFYSEDDVDSDGGFTYGDDSDDSRYNYTVLSEPEIRSRQEEEIARVAAFYSVTRSAATALLLQFNWSVNKLNDAWVVDEQSVLTSAGLQDGLLDRTTRPRSADLVLCEICFEPHKISRLHSAACGRHRYCNDCWTGYVGSAVADGPRCLTLRCMEPSCTAAVGEDAILKFSPNPETRNKYFSYLVRSFVEDQRSMKWCPAPNCEFAVEFASGSGGFDVNCLCSNQFCWNCIEESHQPVDCETVKKWIVKNSSESENVTYILAYTKPCPKCKRPIEKNDGCSHMTCNSACRHQFCWTCLGAWKGHKNCNKFKDKAKDKTKETEASKLRKSAKISLQRYTHYYERWANNHKSRDKAIEDLDKFRNTHMEKIKTTQFLDGSNKENITEFIVEAWEQIIECRRVLKWTYAYGYYIPSNEKAKKDFFEYVQGEAERGLERLHGYAEKELKPCIEATEPLDNFQSFQRDLVSLTKVTKTYFENLVKALQNGLADIEPVSKACKRKVSPSVKPGAAPKASKPKVSSVQSS